MRYHDQAAVRRWGTSAFAIVAAHAALIALAMNWYTQRPVPGVSLPAIMVDMAPVSSAPQPTQMDLAPGPVMQQADASPPEPAIAEAVQEQIAPTPPQEKPEVVAPPEQKAEPTPPKPEPAKVEPEKKPAPVKPKVVRADAKKPTEAPPAPRTTASPRRSVRRRPCPSPAPAHRPRPLLPTTRWLLAHLQRFKQYPPAAKAAGQQGTRGSASPLGRKRSGAFRDARLGGSSGHPDWMPRAWRRVRRAAQPFPTFPLRI